MTPDQALSVRFDPDAAGKKVLTPDQIRGVRRRLKEAGATLVFTNGCFDLIHPGHVAFLQRARSLGDALLLALNSDDSVRRIKGRGRPILSIEERIGVLSGLEAVDYICVFEEDTPHGILRDLLPDVLVKGGDYSQDQIVAREVVEDAGGHAVTISTAYQTSTTAVIKRILKTKTYKSGKT
ncbi:MAG: D-glycero-beta-D-manno-heptose 1-phosphate adenylyltransferase [Gemmatimonadota bacterium]|nr:D-glycero-beta-D-manno-heptose 1-phosphate adenylyltransferase [Gemmatimonadota bacterium]